MNLSQSVQQTRLRFLTYMAYCLQVFLKWYPVRKVGARALSFLYGRIRHSLDAEIFDLTLFINQYAYNTFYLTEFSCQQQDCGNEFMPDNAYKNK